MKKHLSICIAAVLTAGCLSACASGNSASDTGSAPAGDAGKLQIVTTIFPEYDWVMNILGDNPADAEVTMLLDTGVDLHSYQPAAQDILKISTCDVFVYVGGESDAWVEDVLAEAENKEMAVVNLMEAMGDSVKEEEVVEGMEAEEEEEGEEGEEEEAEYDEHVWLSLKNAEVLTGAIADAVKTADPDNAEVYDDNAAAYTAKLEALDAEYEKTVDEASVHTLLFGDRFPFRYMTDDYGLDYYAAFVGCSAETEASFETITFLANKVDELGLHAVMTIEGTDHRIAETIVQNTETKDQEILTMDSMRATTAGDVADGANYLAIMEGNLDVLKEALK